MELLYHVISKNQREFFLFIEMFDELENSNSKTTKRYKREKKNHGFCIKARGSNN